jgi:hypothetical protein
MSIEIVDLHINSMVDLSIATLVYQRVYVRLWSSHTLPKSFTQRAAIDQVGHKKLDQDVEL